MRTVHAILAARIADADADCTEDESAALKRHIREFPDTPLADTIAELFPVEYGEVENEE